MRLDRGSGLRDSAVVESETEGQPPISNRHVLFYRLSVSMPEGYSKRIQHIGLPLAAQDFRLAGEAGLDSTMKVSLQPVLD